MVFTPIIISIFALLIIQTANRYSLRYKKIKYKIPVKQIIYNDHNNKIAINRYMYINNIVHKNVIQ